MFRCCDGAEFLSQFHVLEVNNIGLVRRKSLRAMLEQTGPLNYFLLRFFLFIPSIKQSFFEPSTLLES